MYFNPCKVPTGFQLGTGFLPPCGELIIMLLTVVVTCSVCARGCECGARGDPAHCLKFCFDLSVMFTMLMLAVSNDSS